jgi:hypothetical protein
MFTRSNAGYAVSKMLYFTILCFENSSVRGRIAAPGNRNA